MKNCQKRNAVLDEKLWFRRDLFSRDCDKGDDASLMTVNEIINGKVFENFIHMLWLVLFSSQLSMQFQLIPVCVYKCQCHYFNLRISQFFRYHLKRSLPGFQSSLIQCLFSLWLF